MTKKPNMPFVTFSGNEGQGTVSFNKGSLTGFSQNIGFKVQVLRPLNFVQGHFGSTFAPLLGYGILNNQKTLVQDSTGSSLQVSTTKMHGSFASPQG